MTDRAHPPTAAIGVDLGGTKTEAIALGPDGRELWRLRVPTPSGDYDGTVRTVAALVAQARQALGGLPCTVGVGTPGAAARDGRMKNCNSTALNGRPLPADLAAAIGQPVRVANDANCLALSEAVDGAGAGADVVFAVILGTGTGAGIAVGGRVLTGPNRLAGEWGHNPLPWRRDDDPAWTCWCGLPGCIESVCSGPGLWRDHTARGGVARDAVEVAAQAAAGDPLARATLDRWTDRLARALTVTVNLLDPDVIVLAGGLSRLPGLAQALPPLMQRHAFRGGTDETLSLHIVPSLHGDSSGVRGAAWLWREPDRLHAV